MTRTAAQVFCLACVLSRCSAQLDLSSDVPYLRLLSSSEASIQWIASESPIPLQYLGPVDSSDVEALLSFPSRIHEALHVLNSHRSALIGDSVLAFCIHEGIAMMPQRKIPTSQIISDAVRKDLSDWFTRYDPYFSDTTVSSYTNGIYGLLDELLAYAFDMAAYNSVATYLRQYPGELDQVHSARLIASASHVELAYFEFLAASLMFLDEVRLSNSSLYDVVIAEDSVYQMMHRIDEFFATQISIWHERYPAIAQAVGLRIADPNELSMTDGTVFRTSAQSVLRGQSFLKGWLHSYNIPFRPVLVPR